MSARWTDPVAPIQRGIFAALVADESLAELVDGRVYDHVPENAVYPYVTVGEAIAAPDNTLDGYGADTVAVVHVWSEYRGFVEPNAIGGLVVGILDRQPMRIEGHRVVAVRWKQTTPMKDPNPRVRHTVVRLQVVTEQE